MRDPPTSTHLRLSQLSTKTDAGRTRDAGRGPTACGLRSAFTVAFQDKYLGRSPINPSLRTDWLFEESFNSAHTGDYAPCRTAGAVGNCCLEDIVLCCLEDTQRAQPRFLNLELFAASSDNNNKKTSATSIGSRDRPTSARGTRQAWLRPRRGQQPHRCSHNRR